MAGIVQNGQKNLIFFVAPKQRKQLNVLSTTYGRKLYLLKTVIIMIIAILVIMLKIILVKTITIAA